MIESMDDDDKKIPKRKGISETGTPVLDNFSRDLNKLAEEGKLDPVIGREREIMRIAQILSRRKKNNPIITKTSRTIIKKISVPPTPQDRCNESSRNTRG